MYTKVVCFSEIALPREREFPKKETLIFLDLDFTVLNEEALFIGDFMEWFQAARKRGCKLYGLTKRSFQDRVYTNEILNKNNIRFDLLEVKGEDDYCGCIYAGEWRKSWVLKKYVGEDSTDRLIVIDDQSNNLYDMHNNFIKSRPTCDVTLYQIRPSAKHIIGHPCFQK